MLSVNGSTLSGESSYYNKTHFLAHFVERIANAIITNIMREHPLSERNSSRFLSEAGVQKLISVLINGRAQKSKRFQQT